MISVRVPAKINLCLGVGPVRDDGYHPLATVYQAIDLYDEVRATPSPDDAITISVQMDDPREQQNSVVPENEDNLAVKAAKLLRETTGVTEGASLAIRKLIPVAGGMAGGSADAAAALVACNELWGTGLSRIELESLAAQLGSDVPFLLHGGNAIGGGRGEHVSPVLAKGSYQWVFAIAETGLSTAAVYREFDRLHEGRTVPDPEIPEEMLAALRAGDAHALGETLSNDLTEAALSLRPELGNVLDVGYDCDALGAILSGSGPTALFLASDEQHAVDISIALASSEVCADVAQALGPVTGARLV